MKVFSIIARKCISVGDGSLLFDYAKAIYLSVFP